MSSSASRSGIHFLGTQRLNDLPAGHRRHQPFQRSGQLSALLDAALAVPTTLVQEVYEELTLEQQSEAPDIRGLKRAARSSLHGSPIAVRKIFPEDTAAVERLLLLRKKRTGTADIGEAASIALASTDDTLVFVTADSKAASTGLNELYRPGERVIRATVLVRRLQEAGALSGAHVRAVEPQLAGKQALPSWWKPWLTELAAPS